MKINVKKAPVTILAMLGALLLAGCSNLINPGTGQKSGSATGQVRISVGEIANSAARTVYPVKPGESTLDYVYTFTKGGAGKTLTPDTGGVYTLETGTDWNVAVVAYKSTTHDAANKVGVGSVNFEVTNSASVQNINVTLYPVADDGEGKLDYSISYPAGITVVALTFEEVDGAGTVTISAYTSDGITATHAGTPTVNAGFYRLTVSLTDNLGRTAGKKDIVHIYNGMTTTLPAAGWAFTTGDFTATLIETAGITGLTAPATGGTPTASGALAAAAGDTAKYEVTSIDWKQGSDPHSGVFAPLTAYTAEIKLTAKPGYKFKAVHPATTITPSSNAGTPAAAAPGADVAQNTLTFTVSFDDTTGGTSPLTINLWTNDTTTLAASSDSLTLFRPAHPTAAFTGPADDTPAGAVWSGWQWFLNGKPVSGQTTSAYTFESLGKGDGTYTVSLRVKNSATNIWYSSADIPVTVYSALELSGLNAAEITALVQPAVAAGAFTGSGTTDSPYVIPLSGYDLTNAVSLAALYEGLAGVTGKYFSLNLSSATGASIVDSGAANKTAVAGITLPKRADFTGIGANAFDGFTNLKTAVMPANVTSIGAAAFKDTALTSVTIPAGVTAANIGTDAFAGTTSLATVKVPVGNFAAYKAKFSLTPANAVITDGAEAAAFSTLDISNATQLLNFYNNVIAAVPAGNFKLDLSDASGTSIVSTSLSTANKNRITAVTLPSGLTDIGASAFSNFQYLPEITLPPGVATVGANAFSSTAFKVIRVSSDPIGKRALLAGSGIAVTAVITDGTTVAAAGAITTESNSNTFYTKVNDAFVDTSGNITVDYTGFTGIYQPPWSGSNILSNGVRNRITEVIVPDTVLTFYQSAFAMFNGLTNIEIPDSVTSIGNYAFQVCSSLTGITFAGNTPPTTISNDVFDNVAAAFTTITVPTGTVGAYMAAFSGKVTAAAIRIVGTTAIGFPQATVPSLASGELTGYNAVFVNEAISTSLRAKITGKGLDPTGVIVSGTTAAATSALDLTTYANFAAFCNNAAAAIPTGGIALDISACTSASIGNSSSSNTSIPDATRARFTSVTWPTTASFTTIGEYAFHKFTGLTSITFPASVTTFGKYAFYQCSGLTSFIISGALGSGAMGQDFHVFDHCDSLSSIEFKGTTINTSAISMGNFTKSTYYDGNDVSITVPNGKVPDYTAALRSIFGARSIIKGTTDTTIVGIPANYIGSELVTFPANSFSDVTTVYNYANQIGGQGVSSPLINNVQKLKDAGLPDNAIIWGGTTAVGFVDSAGSGIATLAAGALSSVTTVVVPNGELAAYMGKITDLNGKGLANTATIWDGGSLNSSYAMGFFDTTGITPLSSFALKGVTTVTVPAGQVPTYKALETDLKAKGLTANSVSGTLSVTITDGSVTDTITP